MKKYLIAITVFLYSHCQSFATWSIILIDPQTKEIGIAGASCTYNCDGIGKIVPNVGAVIVQAMSNNQAREKGIQMIIAEATPEQIIQAMRDPIFDPERQQYAVVTIKYINEPITYTGNLTNPINGILTNAGVSVQGNTLASDTALQTIMEAVQKGQRDSLHLAEILMNALEGGSTAGGDKRCGEQRATSAFITIVKPNERKPYLDLIIFGQGKGGANAVDLLRVKYDKWKRKHGDDLN